ncbi:MAG: carboxypeptidase-like regulatory domain-containing protein [Gemmatimonadota bacterium]
MANPSLLGITLAAVLWPGPVLGQAAYTVEGRVVEKDATAGIPNATLELEGSSAATAATARTRADGRFRFHGVDPGGYTIRVLRHGYRPRSQYVFVDEDVALILPLEMAPTVEGRGRSGPPGKPIVALRGVVRESEWGLPLPEVDVLTDLGRGTTTGVRGGFLLGGIPRDRPLLVSVRAFGYMPLDTVLRFGGADFHDLKLIPDPQVQRRIRRQWELLELRSAAGSERLGGLDREALLASGAPTLSGVLGTHYGELSSRVTCVVLDERTAKEPTHLLKLTPGGIQRVELFSHPGEPEGVVARVYSRRFIRDLIAGGVEAASGAIAYVHEAGSGTDAPADGPICPIATEGEP